MRVHLRPGIGRMVRLKGEYVASVDLGSHTARLLISERVGGPGLFRPIARERVYVRLADGKARPGMPVIPPRAVESALMALKRFVTVTERYGVKEIHAVATGIMRSAVNRDALLDRISRETGIQPRVITGEEEAILTARGVLHSLERAAVPYRIFDLGGGTTEIITGQGDVFQTISLPLGAMTLTREFLSSDPPADAEMEALEGQVDKILTGTFPRSGAVEGALLVGTGGTVTTLGAMVHRVAARDIKPEAMNGLRLEREAVEALFEQMTRMPERERALLEGLDSGRADVIVAGTLVVLGIMRALRSPQVTVSLSDILEGILIETLRPGSG